MHDDDYIEFGHGLLPPEPEPIGLIALIVIILAFCFGLAFWFARSVGAI
jgi:hypothetical protein